MSAGLSVLKVSPHRAMDLDYWSFMHMWTPTALPKIMRWLMDYSYDRRLVNRPVETMAKRDIQRVGVDIEVSWILSRIGAGFPIGEKGHENWFDAFNTQNITEADRKHNVRRRDCWPDRVTPSVIEEDFKAFIRAHGRTVYTGSVNTSIRRVLPEGSYRPQTQMTVRTVDNRTGQATSGRVRLHSWPDPEEIFGHLRHRYGTMVDEIYEDMREIPEVKSAAEQKDEF
jgi:hypothetical protein